MDDQGHQTRSGPLRVVVIGSGFGGLFAAKALRRVDVEVTLISKTAHHLFQPMLYQLTTGILSEGQIAPATREVLPRQKNAHDLGRRSRCVVVGGQAGRAVRGRPGLRGAGQGEGGSDHPRPPRGLCGR